MVSNRRDFLKITGLDIAGWLCIFIILAGVMVGRADAGTINLQTVQDREITPEVELHQSNAVNLPLVPYPRQVEFVDDTLTLPHSVTVFVSPDASDNERFAVEDMQRTLVERMNLTLVIEEVGSGESEPVNTMDHSLPAIFVGNPQRDPWIARRLDDCGVALPTEDEGYALCMDAGEIMIGAESTAGILYGTMTLRQILASRPEARQFPALRIIDWPEFSMRGVSDDIARGQVSNLDNFKKIIRFLAEYKLNVYCLYLEDKFRFPSFPAIGFETGGLTPSDVDELEAYASRYNVQIIPIFQMLGHVQNLVNMDELAHLGEYPGARDFAITDEIYEFLERVIADLAATFDSPYIHAGLDETRDMGFGRTRLRVEQEGLAAVYGKYATRLNEIIKQNGKQMIMYSDIMIREPETMEYIPMDIIQNDWFSMLNPDARESMPQFLAKNYQHLPQTMFANHLRSFPGSYDNTGDLSNSLVPDMIEHKRNGGIVLGALLASWADYGARNFRELNYYGYARFAQWLWNPEDENAGEMQHRFFVQHYGHDVKEEISNIYSSLAYWPGSWYRLQLSLYRHPYFNQRRGHEITESEIVRVEENARQALRLIDEVEPRVLYNKDELDYMRFAAHINLVFTESQRLADIIYGKNRIESAPSDDVILIQRVQKHLNNLRSKKDRFAYLWMRTNRSNNLIYNLEEYNTLLALWEGIVDDLNAGRTPVYPITPAQWIYHPQAFDGETTISQAFFRKTFEKPESIDQMKIQLIGDSQVVLYVNGHLVTKQESRITLSAKVNSQVVNLFDLTPYLVEGTNVIAVDSKKWGTRANWWEPVNLNYSAGFHLYGMMTGPEGVEQPFLSDSNWKVSTEKVNDWTSVSFNSDDWLSAQGEKSPRIRVTYPDFKRNICGFADFLQ